MKKSGVVVLAISATLLSSTAAGAASKSAILVKAFQKYEADARAADLQALNQAQALFDSRMAASKSKLLEAQRQMSLANQVTILMTTSHSGTAPVAIDAVNCPSSRPDCTSAYKSNEFTAGEVATIYSLIGGDAAFLTPSYAEMNLALLQTIDRQIGDGRIRLNDPTAYAFAVARIRAEYQNTLIWTQQYAQAQTQALASQEAARSLKPTISSAVLAAKRAASNSSIFEKAFLTSFRFDYNARRLDELARAPWKYISSLKSLNDAIAVTQQSEDADAISAHYTYSSAAKFNRTYGNLFLNEPGYRTGFAVIAGIYKATTGTVLRDQ